MKKIVTLFMFTFLALTGYYVGVAVAQNNAEEMKSSEPVGVMVVEEEYSVEATPDMTKEHDKDEHAKDTGNENDDTEAEVVEEDVTEDDEE
ncbi:MAG: hypothetical protein J6K16_07095 [Alphaproteobacteria bacterium]|nr:hypothetical protein [Alphaproteobacteria bacterium]